MKWLRHSITVFGVGLLITVGTIARSGTEYFHESRWNPTVSLDRSNYRPVTVWGWPAYVIVDGPAGMENSRIDRGDDFRGRALVIDLALWTLCAAIVYSIGLAILIVVSALRP